MIHVTAQPDFALPRDGVSGLVRRAWHALASLFARKTTLESAAPEAVERDALAGLDPRMLKDIGASCWLVARAAEQVHEDWRTRVQGGWY